MYINSRVSDCLLHISNQYETRVRYLHINMLIEDYTLDIASLVTSGLTKTLQQESLTEFQRSQNFCLFRHLDPDPPAFANEISREEIINIGIETFL